MVRAARSGLGVLLGAGGIAGTLWLGFGDPDGGWLVASLVVPAVASAYGIVAGVLWDRALQRLSSRQDRFAVDPLGEHNAFLAGAKLTPTENTGGISTAVVPAPDDG